MTTPTFMFVVPRYRDIGSCDRPSLASLCIGGQSVEQSVISKKDIKSESSLVLKFIHSANITLTWRLSLWLQHHLSRSIWNALMQSIRLHLRLCLQLMYSWLKNDTCYKTRCKSEPYERRRRLSSAVSSTAGYSLISSLVWVSKERNHLEPLRS